MIAERVSLPAGRQAQIEAFYKNSKKKLQNCGLFEANDHLTKPARSENVGTSML